VLGSRPGERNDLIGYVPQNYVAGAGEAIRAHDSVTLGLIGRRWGLRRTSPAEKARVAEALESVEATEFADRRVSALSGGQRQRIALARALSREPFLVVLDEPNSNLDAEGEAALTDAIARIRQRGGIAVVIAHRPSALAAVDMVGIVQGGKLTAFGAKDEVMQAHVSPRPKVAGNRPAAKSRGAA